MSSWLELLKAASSLLLFLHPPPPKGDILRKRARTCLGWSQQGEERVETAVGGREGFPSLPKCRKTSLFPKGREAEAPPLGHFVLGWGKPARTGFWGREKGARLAGLGLFQLPWSSAGQ